MDNFNYDPNDSNNYYSHEDTGDNGSYIPTRKKRVKYHFVKSLNEENEENVETTYQNSLSYYQICIFANPRTKRHHVRKFILNRKNEFESIKDYFISERRYKKLLQIKNVNEYKCFSTYNLQGIEYPTLSDISMARSDMIAQDHGYYGYAKF